MRSATPYQYNMWMKRLIHLQSRKHSVPDGTLDFTVEWFGKSEHIQKMFALQNAVKPQIETALKVMELIERSGIVPRTKLGKR